ncbi:MAG TPA: hypothetical protein VM869_23255 [Enhygromyxa sp.]|nr:hypothetical protein [Enhygromyxa sp.]
MILTAALALTLTVAIIGYAASRGRSPLLWGGASILITVVATLLAWHAVARMGATDLVFDQSGGGWAMLAALAGPVVALVGNGVLASGLAALPLLRASAGSKWRMWRVADRDDEGCACELHVNTAAIVGMRGGDELFVIPHAQLSAVEVDGETLLLRVADGRQLRLILGAGDPDDRSARIDEITAIKRAIERSAQPDPAMH